MADWFSPALITIFSTLAGFALGFKVGFEYLKSHLSKHFILIRKDGYDAFRKRKD